MHDEIFTVILVLYTLRQPSGTHFAAIALHSHNEHRAERILIFTQLQ